MIEEQFSFFFSKNFNKNCRKVLNLNKSKTQKIEMNENKDGRLK